MVTIKGENIVIVMIYALLICASRYFINNIRINNEVYSYSRIENIFMFLGLISSIILIISILYIVVILLVLLAQKEFKINIKKLKL